MHKLHFSLHPVALAVFLSCTAQTFAAVSPAEAGKLGTELTPLGGEKAGNKDGSIPAWTGGLTTVDPAFKNGGRRSDPYANEKPLFSIKATDVDKYADKLTEGQKDLLKKYPQSYRLDVYPTHRTAAAPPWVYEGTLKNATRAKIIDGVGGPQPEGAFNGVPFPIPKTGAEVIWNHLLRWRGESYHWEASQYLITSDGKKVLTNNGQAMQQTTYYNKAGSLDKFDGTYYMLRLVNAGPPIRAGEGVVARQNFNEDKTSSYVYLAGQRRVRKLPNACCDTPSPTTAGVMTIDDLEVFNGRIGRFDWKLLGKKEMFVPYNTNKALQPTKDAELIGDHHLNPDHIRWELHRVWVVEANLKSGERHNVSKSIYYIDEDSWYGLLADRYDAKGQLVRTLWQLPLALPDLPGIGAKTFGFNDLLSGTWYVNGLMNEKKEQYMVMPPSPDTYFTPESLAGEGVR